MAEKVTYSHEPTSALHQRYDLADPTLAPWTVDGVVVAPYVVPLDYDNTAVKLSFVAKAPGSMAVTSGRLTGAGAHAGVSRDLQTGTTAYDKAAKNGVVQGELTVLTVPRADLDAMGADGLHLDVTVTSAGGERTLSYEIDRHVEQYVVMR